MKNAEQEFSINQLEAAIDAARMCGAGCFTLRDVISHLPGATTNAELDVNIGVLSITVLGGRLPPFA